MRILGGALCFSFISGIAGAGAEIGAPEIDPSQLPALITLVVGGLLILKSRGRNRK